jgi:hypothetical protein
MSFDPNALTIREAQAADDDGLRRLAELDSSRVPSGRLLVGELNGELVAAVPMAGGPAIADPMRATSAVVSLLGLRAARLRGLENRRKSRGRIRRLMPAAGAGQAPSPRRPATAGAPLEAKRAA